MFRVFFYRSSFTDLGLPLRHFILTLILFDVPYSFSLGLTYWGLRFLFLFFLFFSSAFRLHCPSSDKYLLLKDLAFFQRFLRNPPPPPIIPPTCPDYVMSLSNFRRAIFPRKHVRFLICCLFLIPFTAHSNPLPDGTLALASLERYMIQALFRRPGGIEECLFRSSPSPFMAD